jgi:Na+/proline symporter
MGLAFLGFVFGHHALGINFGYPGQPHVLVRFMSLKNRKEALAGAVISFVWGLLIYTGAITVGLLARSVAVQGEPWAVEMVTVEGAQELALVKSAMHMLPGVLSGLVLAAVLAAICSTADSQLVVAGSSAANDIYSRLIDRNGRAAHLFLNRFTILALGILAILLVVDEQREVYQYVLDYGWAVLGASFGPQMILALLWKRASYAGCILGMLAGFVVAIGWKMMANNMLFAGTPDAIEVYNLPLAFVVALLVNVLVSFIVGPTPYEPGETSAESPA